MFYILNEQNIRFYLYGKHGIFRLRTNFRRKAVEETTIMQEMLGRFYFQAGMEESLKIIFRMLQEFIPADHIGLLRIDVESGAFTPILNIPQVFMEENIDPGSHMLLRLKRAHENQDFSPFLWDVLNEPSTQYPAWGEKFRSALSCFLCAQGNRFYLLNILSNKPDIFTKVHVEVFRVFQSSLEQLVNVFFPVYQKGVIFSTQQEKTHDSCKRVRAYQGLKGVWRQVQEVAPTTLPVLLVGETGTGKEVVAEAVHEASLRSKGPLVKVNCGALPETLLESLLFGHEKGAFTGAVYSQRGCFEEAAGGTIFLDEIGELSSLAQSRLLRVLETREVQRLGASRRLEVDFRVVAATNRDLLRMVNEGTFREDLWFRLSAYPIHIPPLRRRKEDLGDLVQYLLPLRCHELALERVPEIGEGELEKLFSYTWSGNIRQLIQVLDRALLRANSKKGLLRFPQEENHSIFDFSSATYGTEAGVPATHREALAQTGTDEKSVASTSLYDNAATFVPLQDKMQEYLEEVLEHCHGKVYGEDGAARLLGMSPEALRMRLKRYGLKAKKY